ncbi:MAG TPA: sugar ABC transporter permease [Dehalococcoidia bacterium]|nr:sugar ABC transporter permease [Dehalococcoidia bacterium]
MIGRKWWTPWLWMSPAMVLLGVFLVYPVVNTFVTSFMDADSAGGIVDLIKDPGKFVGLDNYEFIIDNPRPLVSNTHAALYNNGLWLIVFTGLTVPIGLIFAVLASRVRYEAVAKSAIFIPMAISFVAASVIWRFMYEFNPDVGTVNAIKTAVGSDSTAWLLDRGSPQTPITDVGPDSAWGPFQVNNFALIMVGVWMWAGFAMVVLSAGLKGISTEVLEAARVDGAGEWQIFRRIILPILSPTIIVVATTLVIQALKKFDLVWVMTGGRAETDVVATLFYTEAFRQGEFGRGAALAVVLLLWVVPIMVLSIRRFQFQEETR